MTPDTSPIVTCQRRRSGAGVPRTTHTREQGFTLLEVLVSVAIFAIGLLGIAGLQVAGMRYTQSASLKTDAVRMAENIGERMRANLEGVLDASAPYNRAANPMPTTTSADCATAECTPVELAIFDLVAWRELIDFDADQPEPGLPGGDGIVCIDSTPEDGLPGAWACDDAGDVYAIKVAYEDRLAGVDDEGQPGDVAAGDDAVVKVVRIRFMP